VVEGALLRIKEVEVKVLIAESGRETVDDISLVFNMCLPHWKLITTDSGKECLDMAKNNSLDMVILGDLADMSGLDVIEKIRGYSKVPVMVLSNIDDEPSVVKAFDLGADGYMTKPFHQLELIARVRVILRRRDGRLITRLKNGGLKRSGYARTRK